MDFRIIERLPAPRRALLFVLVLGVIAALPMPAMAAVRALPAGDADKPEDPTLVFPSTAFDCSGRDTLVLAPGLNLTRNDDTTGGQSLLPGYTCRGWPEEGPEHIYRLEVAVDLELWAVLGDLGDQDLDLFLLDGCDSDLCIASGNTEVRGISLTAGTYYLVVDGYSAGAPAAGPYTLTVEARWLGVPPIVCAPGGAETVTCAGELISRSGELFGQTNNIQSAACSPSVLRGGERWYEITLPATHEVRITASTLLVGLDLAFWLFDGCGAEAVCLDFVDDKIGGQSEILTFANDDTQAVTVYLAVDSPRPAAAEGEGVFTVDFACQSNVPTEKTSLGSLRAMFR